MTSQRSQPIPDQRALERALSDMRAEMRRLAESDVLASGDRRLVLRSPDGHFWSVTVGDDGALSTVDLGTSAP